MKKYNLPEALKGISALLFALGLFVIGSGIALVVRSFHIADDIMGLSSIMAYILIFAGIIIAGAGIFIFLTGIWLWQCKAKARTITVVVSIASMVVATLSFLLPLRIHWSVRWLLPGAWILLNIFIVHYLVHDQHIRKLFPQ